MSSRLVSSRLVSYRIVSSRLVSYRIVFLPAFPSSFLASFLVFLSAFFPSLLASSSYLLFFLLLASSLSRLVSSRLFTCFSLLSTRIISLISPCLLCSPAHASRPDGMKLFSFHRLSINQSLALLNSLLYSHKPLILFLDLGFRRPSRAQTEDRPGRMDRRRGLEEEGQGQEGSCSQRQRQELPLGRAVLPVKRRAAQPPSRPLHRGECAHQEKER